MDTLPHELLQVINGYLEFIDQIKFRSSCKWHYEKVSITQIIPYILIREEKLIKYTDGGCGRRSYISVIDCIKLNEFYLQIPKLINEWEVFSDYYNICVMNPNKYNKIPYKRSLFDDIYYYEYEGEFNFDEDEEIRYNLTDLKLYYTDKLLFDDGEPFNLKIFVTNCITIFNNCNNDSENENKMIEH